MADLLHNYERSTRWRTCYILILCVVGNTFVKVVKIYGAGMGRSHAFPASGWMRERERKKNKVPRRQVARAPVLGVQSGFGMLPRLRCWFPVRDKRFCSSPNRPYPLCDQSNRRPSSPGIKRAWRLNLHLVPSLRMSWAISPNHRVPSGRVQGNLYLHLFFIFWILHGLKFWIQKHLEIKIRMSLINVILRVLPFSFVWVLN